MNLYERISQDNRIKYGTEAERILEIIINQYSDRTHFIYEILQNAEDAEASYIKFQLERDSLYIYHNGRPFNERDIEGVCGIADGTKDDGTRIGHFGIGFKSVYCYTDSPNIYSDKHHFVIKNRLFPEEIGAKAGLSSSETCMVLPFNKATVSKETAYKEIKDALLKKINAQSILMLSNIEDVEIGISGHADRIQINKAKYSLDNNHSDNVFSLSLHTTITNVTTGKERISDNDYLFFTDAQKEATAIIFKVDGKELKAVKNSKIYAFFPTAKEAHQNFYIHAPFDTTPARDNFKEGAEYGKHNLELVKNIGELIWFAFTWLKDNKYLSVSGFNTVFPVYEYEEEDVLYGIYENSIDMIKEEIILPTNNPYEFKRYKDIYVPLWGNIVDIFDDQDLRTLMRQKNVSWLAKEFSTEAYAEVRRFLNENLQLTTLDWKDLVTKLDAFFLKQKSLDWTEKLMDKIESYCIKKSSRDSHFINVTHIPFVRTAEGDQICTRDENGKLQVYLNNPNVARFKIDSRFRKNDTIISFYRRALEIPDYNVEQEALENILPKYASKDVKFKSNNPIRENIEDLKVIKDAIYNNPSIVQKICDKYIVTDGTNWYRPSELYIKSNDTRTGYSLVDGIINLKYLSDQYFDNSMLSLKIDEEFFKKLGCNYGIRVLETSKDEYLNTVRKYLGAQAENELRFNIFNKKYISQKMNWAFCYEGFPQVFKDMTPEKSYSIARFLNSNTINFDVRGEAVAADDQHFSGKNVDSAMVYSMIGLMLCHEKWIYIQGDDSPYSPLDIDKNDIRSEYKSAKHLVSSLPFKEVKNALVEWLEANISNQSDVEQIIHYISKPEDLLEVVKLLAKSEAKKDKNKKPISVKDLIEQGDKKQEEEKEGYGLEIYPISEKAKKHREEKLDKELVESLDNFTRFTKGLQFTSRESNAEERAFLNAEYDGHCQICTKRIKKYNGDNYFEAINVIRFSELQEKLKNSSKYGWNSLCLCPNCAAEYNYSSKKISSMYDQIMSKEVEPDSEETIDIKVEIPAGNPIFIKYSPRHFIALKEALKMFAEIQ